MIRKNIILILFVQGLFIAACILVYPTFMDSLNDVSQTVTIGGYENELAELSEDQVVDIKEKAVKYNEKIWASQQGSPFIYQGSDYDDADYDSILTISENSDVMAYIEIPSIDLYLPITHGTKGEDLQYQIGHMRGTSVPIGGENTHCVLAGHTGMQNADLFTNIRKLKAGDLIYINILREIHVYKVIEKNTVQPAEAMKYLEIEKGRDLVTLFTCTPAGINNLRLLVKCERQYPDPVYETADSKKEKCERYNYKALIAAVLWGAIPAAVIVGGFAAILWKHKNRSIKIIDNRKADK